MSKNYYQPEIETMPVEEIQALQSRLSYRAGKVCL